MQNRIKLFFLMYGVCGLLTVLGSMLGNVLGKIGLYAGAIIGGVCGILAVMIWARRFNWIEARNHVSTLIGATLGFVIAAAIAVNNLHTPVIPILCTALVGVGAAAGSLFKRHPA